MLKRFWNFLFYACKHEWETMNTGMVNWSDFCGGHGKYERITLRCKKCGDWKKKDLK